MSEMERVEPPASDARTGQPPVPLNQGVQQNFVLHPRPGRNREGVGRIGIEIELPTYFLGPAYNRARFHCAVCGCCGYTHPRNVLAHVKKVHQLCPCDRHGCNILVPIGREAAHVEECHSNDDPTVSGTGDPASGNRVASTPSLESLVPSVKEIPCSCGLGFDSWAQRERHKIDDHIRHPTDPRRRSDVPTSTGPGYPGSQPIPQSSGPALPGFGQTPISLGQAPTCSRPVPTGLRPVPTGLEPSHMGFRLASTFGRASTSFGHAPTGSKPTPTGLEPSHMGFGLASTFGRASTGFGRASTSFGQASTGSRPAPTSLEPPHMGFGLAPIGFGQASTGSRPALTGVGQAHASSRPAPMDFELPPMAFGQTPTSFGQTPTGPRPAPMGFRPSPMGLTSVRNNVHPTIPSGPSTNRTANQAGPGYEALGKYLILCDWRGCGTYVNTPARLFDHWFECHKTSVPEALEQQGHDTTKAGDASLSRGAGPSGSQ